MGWLSLQTRHEQDKMKTKTLTDVWIPGIVKAANVRHNYVGDSQRSRCGRASRPPGYGYELEELAKVRDNDSGNCARCQLLKIRNEAAP